MTPVQIKQDFINKNAIHFSLNVQKFDPKNIKKNYMTKLPAVIKKTNNNEVIYLVVFVAVIVFIV